MGFSDKSDFSEYLKHDLKFGETILGYQLSEVREGVGTVVYSLHLAFARTLPLASLSFPPPAPLALVPRLQVRRLQQHPFAIPSSFLSFPPCSLLPPAHLLQWDVGLGLRSFLLSTRLLVHFEVVKRELRSQRQALPFQRSTVRCVIFVCF